MRRSSDSGGALGARFWYSLAAATAATGAYAYWRSRNSQEAPAAELFQAPPDTPDPAAERTSEATSDAAALLALQEATKERAGREAEAARAREEAAAALNVLQQATAEREALNQATAARDVDADAANRERDAEAAKRARDADAAKRARDAEAAEQHARQEAEAAALRARQDAQAAAQRARDAQAAAQRARDAEAAEQRARQEAAEQRARQEAEAEAANRLPAAEDFPERIKNINKRINSLQEEKEKASVQRYSEFYSGNSPSVADTPSGKRFVQINTEISHLEVKRYILENHNLTTSQITEKIQNEMRGAYQSIGLGKALAINNQADFMRLDSGSLTEKTKLLKLVDFYVKFLGTERFITREIGDFDPLPPLPSEKAVLTF